MPQLPDDMDVWVLAGQSNMAGSAGGEEYTPPSPDVWLFNLRDAWQIAEEPFMKYRYEAPEDHIAGFSVLAPGSERNLVCNSRRAPDDPTTVLIRTYLPAPAGSVLWYGKGLMPYCNLADTEDLAAPVFGPWPIPNEPGPL